MKTIILVLGLLAVFGLLVCFRQFRVEKPPLIAVSSAGPTIERLERLSHLVTSRVQIADVLVGTGDGCRGAWLIRGDALLSVNLSQAAITEKDEATKRATIRLPQPEILQARVDHERTKTWEVRSMVWLPWNAHHDRLRDEVMLQAQRLVAQAAGLEREHRTSQTVSRDDSTDVVRGDRLGLEDLLAGDAYRTAARGRRSITRAGRRVSIGVIEHHLLDFHAFDLGKFCSQFLGFALVAVHLQDDQASAASRTGRRRGAGRGGS